MNMKPTLGLLVLLSALLSTTARSDDEHHSHPAPEKLGTVMFPTSCSAKLTHSFERAVALLHSFAYEAAEKAFKRVEEIFAKYPIAQG